MAAAARACPRIFKDSPTNVPANARPMVSRTGCNQVPCSNSNGSRLMAIAAVPIGPDTRDRRCAGTIDRCSTRRSTGRAVRSNSTSADSTGSIGNPSAAATPGPPDARRRSRSPPSGPGGIHSASSTASTGSPPAPRNTSSPSRARARLYFVSRISFNVKAGSTSSTRPTAPGSPTTLVPPMGWWTTSAPPCTATRRPRTYAKPSPP